MELVTAARAATTDYIQNGTDLTEAVVKAASALQPITSEHVRRICEMTYHDAYERMFAEKTGMYQYVSFDPPDAIRAAEMLDALQLGFDNQNNFNKLANYQGNTMDKTASAPSMPRKFQRMNTHELWTKAASGTDIPDSNPTRELQRVHRDLKDSISTVKSELYAAEHNEKLAMIDMVKQAQAGLSAGHSMEQVLHAALSVVDATEPLMAKTAHDLCATIIEACAGHQNSGFRKEAQVFMGQKELMDKAKKNSDGWKKNPTKLIYNFDHNKKASAFQEVNPNHPIPQKFKKLAEANIQRKHLEVTLDELNRNMDYFNEQLKNEFLR